MAYYIIIGRDEKTREKLGLQGTVLLGKQYIQMGPVTSLSNNVYLDVATSHVIFICGKRGGGKCVSGDTLITLHDGSLRPIQELANDDSDIMTLQPDLKIRSARKEGFYQRSVSCMYAVRFRTGKEIIPEETTQAIKNEKTKGEVQ